MSVAHCCDPKGFLSHPRLATRKGLLNPVYLQERENNNPAILLFW
jgi:hypothetical protein